MPGIASSPAYSTAASRKRVAHRGEIVDDEARVRLPRGRERLLDADVQLLLAGVEPEPPRARSGSGFGSSGMPSRPP